MWYGAALLGMFVAYITAKGELPTYLGFLIPQGTATQPPGTLVAVSGSATPNASMFVSSPLPGGGTSGAFIAPGSNQVQQIYQEITTAPTGYPPIPGAPTAPPSFNGDITGGFT